MDYSDELNLYAVEDWSDIEGDEEEEVQDVMLAIKEWDIKEVWSTIREVAPLMTALPPLISPIKEPVLSIKEWDDEEVWATIREMAPLMTAPPPMISPIKKTVLSIKE